MRHSYFLLTVALFVPALAGAGESADWNGKRAAVALTYDDSLNAHLDTVIPQLDKHGFKATFYLTVGFPPFEARMTEWRQLAAAGHELGNHTLFHPCRADLPGREWVDAGRDLSTWSVQRTVDNIRIANTVLQAIDGKQERTFAYPCGDKLAAGESYVTPLQPSFVAARGVQEGMQSIDEVDLFDLRAHMVNGDSIEQLTALVDQAIERGALLVFLFHGVGGEHGLNVSAENHAALVSYLDQRQNKLWVAPLVDVASFIKAQR